MNYKIDAIEYYLPERIIDNSILNRQSEIDIDFLEKKIGIKKRHIAGDDETTSQMATYAAKKLFSKYNLNAQLVEQLIICTQNPDYKLPTTACIVQNNLGLSESCMAFDINLGCSGFIYSLAVAGTFIKSGIIKSSLLIMADQYSKLIDYADKNTAAIFGDAASAILVNSAETNYGVLDTVFGTDGSNADKLIAYNSGVTINQSAGKYLFMDGREIFKFSVIKIPESVKFILQKNGLKTDDIRFFIFHQANKYILREIQNRLEISDEQMVIDLEDYGNTVSSTIPIAFKNLVDKKTLHDGDLIILCGFGVGLSWGTVLYRFNI